MPFDSWAKRRKQRVVPWRASSMRPHRAEAAGAQTAQPTIHGADPHPLGGPPGPDVEAALPPVADGLGPEVGPDVEAAPPPAADGIAPEAGPVAEVAPLPVADRQQRDIPWGNGEWQLAEVHSKGRLVGCGATCKGQFTPGSGRVCKHSVSCGDSGLTRADLMLRLKRWLIAGLDDEDWDTDGPRAAHIAMGGRHMQDFVDGLSEAECDRIANGGVVA